MSQSVRRVTRRLVMASVGLGAVGLGLGGPGPAGAPAWAQSGPQPLQIVNGIYRAYMADQIPAPPYSPAVAARLSRARDAGEIDFDFFVVGQDFQLTGLSVRELSRTATAAAVEARFRNFGEARVVVTHLQVVDGRWMIVNVRIPADGFDLRRALRLAPAG